MARAKRRRPCSKEDENNEDEDFGFGTDTAENESVEEEKEEKKESLVSPGRRSSSRGRKQNRTIKFEKEEDHQKPKRNKKRAGAKRKPTLKEEYDENSTELTSEKLDIGTRVSVHWSGEQDWFQGSVKKRRGGKFYYVVYDDGDEEWVDLDKRKIRVLAKPSEPQRKKGKSRSKAEKTIKEESSDSDNDKKQSSHPNKGKKNQPSSEKTKFNNEDEKKDVSDYAGVNVDDEKVDDDTVHSDASSKATKPKKRPKKSVPEIANQLPKKSTSEATSTEQATATEQKEPEFICPYCSRRFSGKKCLSRHISNFVCRSDEERAAALASASAARATAGLTVAVPRSVPPPPPPPAASRSVPPSAEKKRPAPEPSVKTRDDDAESKKKKKARCVRGSRENRVCPRCDREFSSALGLKYHMKKRVCENGATQEMPFQTLAPGTRLLSPFGVVEVIRDDREIPTAPFPEDLKQQLRSYQSHESKRTEVEQRARDGTHTANILKRKQLAALYEQGKINSESVISVCYKTDPRIPWDASAGKQRRPEAPPTRPDPNKPQGSFPDRIVECILVQDNRDRFTGDDPKELSKPMLPTVNKPTRLFLKRECLINMYRDNAEVYICHRCGYPFGSRTGLANHNKHRLCLKRALDFKSKITERLNRLETRALVALHKMRDDAERATSVAEDAKASESERELGLLIKGDYVMTRKETKQLNLKKPADKFEDPRVILKDFEEQLKLYKSKMIGTMYPAVFKALKFEKASTKPREKRIKIVKVKKIVKIKKTVPVNVPAKPPSGKKKRPQKKVPPAQPNETPAAPAGKDQAEPEDAGPMQVDFDNLPSIIDVRVLISEVILGRYPSMKVCKDDVKHEEKCTICRKEKNNTPLVPCSFCQNAFHFKCLLQKFTVKPPEPGDAVMCNTCIGYVISMRNRAEKRRLEKMGINDPLPVMQRKQNVVEETKRLVPGEEYQCVVAQGRQAADLIEVLQEAKIRLEQVIHTAKADAVRRAALLGHP